jgi:catechol 2,3-dioxygenase
VELIVSDLDRSVDFYERVIGLTPGRRDESGAALGTAHEELVVLTGVPGARRAGRHAGLYHFALLHPSRKELSRALVRLAVTRTPIDGASDHAVSEAIYLPDPDGNGIELYRDRPRGEWPYLEGGQVALVTEPLDLEALLAEAAGEDPQETASDGLRVGHVHLHVGEIDPALAFYRDLVGLELMAQMPGAAFVANDGYHHHLGLNTWRGRGVPGPPPGTVGLRRWTLVLPDAARLEEAAGRLEAAGVGERDGDGIVARDPWEAELRLVAAGA